VTVSAILFQPSLHKYSSFALPIGLLILSAMASILSVEVTAEEEKDRTGPFTHARRSVRSRDFDQRHLKLELDVAWEERRIEAVATHKVAAYKSIDALMFDAVDMKIHSARLLEGERVTDLKIHQDRGQLEVVLNRVYRPGEELTVEIRYVVEKPKHGFHFVTPDENELAGRHMLWTQSEPEYARYWFPCIDSPSDRLTSEISITVPGDFNVLSNGELISKKAQGDRTRWHWWQKKTHAPYLMSIVAGEFESYAQQWQGLKVTSYVPRGRLDDAERSFAKTPAMMEYFSRKIGFRYPWSKYSQICVDEYGWGGMEHTSATTLNLNTLHDDRAALDVSSDNLVAHELAHQWWGDLVTCKDWGELWLNESFATYFATLWTEHDLGDDEAVWQRRREASSYLEEDKKYRRSLVNYRYNSPSNMFDRHSYPKGSRILHMLRFQLGDDLFWKSIQRYAEVNQYRTVETADFRRAIEDSTGQGMNWFFDQWIYQGGHPEFQFDWRYDRAAKMVRVQIMQVQDTEDGTPLYTTDAEIEIADGDKFQIHRVRINGADQSFSFPAESRPSRVCFDPNDWLLKELTAEKSKQELLDQLASDTHVICRVRAAEQLKNFLADSDVIDALIEKATSDEFWGVRETALKTLKEERGDTVRTALIAVAKEDQESRVRREALAALAEFNHAETRKALREVIATDRSYYAVAAALKALVKVDRKNSERDLVAALKLRSHRQVILQAAIAGLVDLKAKKAAAEIGVLLTETISLDRRVALTNGYGRLKTNNENANKQLIVQVGSQRSKLRDATAKALVGVNATGAISALEGQIDRENDSQTLKTLKESLKKLKDAAK